MFKTANLPHGRAAAVPLVGLILLLGCAARCGAAQPNPERQQQFLKDSLAINRPGPGRYPMTTLHDRTWQDWQKRTGELPPDFELMPSRPFLPDPLTSRTVEGSEEPIRSRADWEKKRQWVRAQFQQWICGSIPPPPDHVDAKILGDRMDGRVRLQTIELRFGPNNAARMTFELMIPPGDAPRPVYMSQWNHRDWAQLAVRRGYIGCIYAGGDLRDDTEEYQAIYPDYDFSRLMRRAWGASRIVDYLLTRPEVNAAQIAITGHSRNGKQSLWAAAFDDRIGAVISSSCGTGGVAPWRYSDPQYCNETLDAIASVANTWFHPRLRYFFGREDKLPIDQNELLALIAPRPLLMHFSIMEHQANAWASEQCFRSVARVYDFLGAPDKIGLFSRDGEHAVAARDVERCIDFLDIHFGRRKLPWQNTLHFDYGFDAWKADHAKLVSGVAAETTAPVALRARYADPQEFRQHRAQMLGALDWLLGDEPAGASPGRIVPTTEARRDWKDRITGRPELKKAGVLHIGPYNAMGDHMAGALYYPLNDDGTTRTPPGGKLPVIVYLHQYAYAHGYAFGYNVKGGQGGSRIVLQKMVDEGFAVLAIDMYGFGTRLQEARHFYLRQPGWSTMGRMVADVSACVDAAASFDFLDARRIYVLGDTIGGMVGLMAAARDERIAAVAAVAACSPWRDSNARYESIRVLAHQHMFLPRLGLFADSPEKAPADVGEIMACIAPRPLMIVSPRLDRHTDSAAMRRTMDAVRAVYQLLGAPAALRFETPREINRMTPDIEKQILRFFQQLDGKPRG